MTDPIQADWLLATLEDARDALDTAIDSLSRHPEEAEEILTEEIAAAYAKLNYAVNTARCGAEGLDTMEDDELVAYPVKELPFRGSSPDALFFVRPIFRRAKIPRAESEENHARAVNRGTERADRKHLRGTPYPGIGKR